MCPNARDTKRHKTHSWFVFSGVGAYVCKYASKVHQEKQKNQIFWGNFLWILKDSIKRV